MAGIKVKNLSKSFKSFKAVDGISFEVAENRVMGFLGPNGAGKTTTLRMLVGLSNPDSGEIVINDQAIIFGKSQANGSFGYLPEQPAFYGWMSGEEYLNFIADVYRMTPDKKKAAIAKVLKTVNLDDARKRKIAGYSNGMKQRLGIAQALINNPKVIIMDEPVSALDPLGRREVLKVISELRKDKTILFSTHILSDVDRICDDVIIVNKGKILIQSPLAELKEKYSKPILEVEFSTDAVGIVAELQSQDWVAKVEESGNHLKIWLKDGGAIEHNIPLKFFGSRDLSVLKYGLNLPEVEDLFVNLIEEAK